MEEALGCRKIWESSGGPRQTPEVDEVTQGEGTEQGEGAPLQNPKIDGVSSGRRLQKNRQSNEREIRHGV